MRVVSGYWKVGVQIKKNHLTKQLIQHIKY